MLRKLPIVTGIALAMTASVMAQEVDLPGTITMTTADVGGTAYNQSIAIGKALQDAYGVSLRVRFVMAACLCPWPGAKSFSPSRAWLNMPRLNGDRKICAPSALSGPKIA